MSDYSLTMLIPSTVKDNPQWQQLRDYMHEHGENVRVNQPIVKEGGDTLWRFRWRMTPDAINAALEHILEHECAANHIQVENIFYDLHRAIQLDTEKLGQRGELFAQQLDDLSVLEAAVGEKVAAMNAEERQRMTGTGS